MSTTRLDARSGVGRWAVAGLVAGIVFAMFEMIMAAIMSLGFFAPLLMIGAIGLGKGALPRSRPSVSRLRCPSGSSFIWCSR